MSEQNETTFDNKCEILSQLWIEYKLDEEFRDFIEYNDIGLPLAFLLSSGIVEVSPKAEMFVNETFALLLAALGKESDEGYESFEDLTTL